MTITPSKFVQSPTSSADQTAPTLMTHASDLLEVPVRVRCWAVRVNTSPASAGQLSSSSIRERRLASWESFALMIGRL